MTKTLPSKSFCDKITFNIDLDDPNDYYEIEGFQNDRLKKFCVWVGYFLTGGILWLILYWKPDYYVKLSKKRCCLLASDVFIIASKSYKQNFAVKSKRLPKKEVSKYYQLENVDNISEVLSFTLMDHLFCICGANVTEIEGLNNQTGHQIMYLSNLENNGSTVQEKTELFGLNIINVEVPSVFKILYAQIISPFYIFQLFSILLWYSFAYEVYATSIVIITVASIAFIIYSVRKEKVKLSKMVKENESIKVTTFRNNDMHEICSSKLVPGDVIVIGNDFVVPADCILISGEVLVNESMLTGESTAVTKTSMKPSEHVFDVDKDKLHILYGGTNAILTRVSHGITKAMVLRTGFNTAKGSLVRSILYPKPINIKYERDGLKFIAIMSILGVSGFIFSVVVSSYGCVETGDIIKKSLDMITVIVPPALPAALSVGIVYAQRRLIKREIFTIQSQRINLAGAINIALFDKTGTITQDGLTFKGVLENISNCFEKIKMNDFFNSDIYNLLGSCHTLGSIKGELFGDPMELEYFKVSKMSFFDQSINEDVSPVPNLKTEGLSSPYAKSDTEKIYQLKQYPFSSEFARGSVLTRAIKNDGDIGEIKLFTKGAPEVMHTLFNPQTIPKNYDDKLEELSADGYRVLAMGRRVFVNEKPHKTMSMAREEIEIELEFLGFLLFENSVKPDSKEVITEIYDAGIKVAMITGDNLMTAIAVSTEVGIMKQDTLLLSPVISNECLYWIDLRTKIISPSFELESSDVEIAVTGTQFRWIQNNRPELVDFLLVKASVFARMRPDEKSMIVGMYEKMDYVTSYCGDGANDCGALKRASVGIALSDLEASVASPFTSRNTSVTCVSALIKEGRCALLTSYGIFKYMVLYSFTQFASLLLIYWRQSMFSDIQYLYIDLIIVDIVALTVTRNEAYSKISRQAPPQRIINVPILLGVTLQILLMIACQILVYYWTISQPWFCSISDQMPDCFERNEETGIIIRALNASERCPGGNCRYGLEMFDRECDEVSDSDENSRWNVEHYVTQILFMYSIFIYISLAVIYSTGPPYRKRLWTNWAFSFAILLLLALNLVILFSNSGVIDGWFEFLYPYWTEDMDITQDIPLHLPPIPRTTDDEYSNTRLYILGMAAVHFIAAFSVEALIANNRALWRFIRNLRKNRPHRKMYANFIARIEQAAVWPPPINKTEKDV